MNIPPILPTWMTDQFINMQLLQNIKMGPGAKPIDTVPFQLDKISRQLDQLNNPRNFNGF
jgi:hypothetical protein